MKDKQHILLLYGWVRSTYSALRNLADYDLKVSISDTTPLGMCQQSKYHVGFHKYPSPYTSEDDFIDELLNIVSHNNIQVIIPSHDETEVIAKNIHRFPKEIQVPIPSYHLLKIANEKSQSQKAAESVNISVPKTLRYRTIADLSRQVAEISEATKFVIKLRRSNSSKGVSYSDNKETLIDDVSNIIQRHELSHDRAPIVQELVEGEGWGVSCLYWEGERIASFTHRRLREKISTGGTSTLRQQCDNPIIDEMAHKLLDSLSWHGLAMVEFKYNPTTKQAWFIEINPRMWGSMHLPIFSGVHFPYLLYKCAVSGPQSAKDALSEIPFKKGRVARWYLGDVIAAAEMLKKGKLIEMAKLLLPGGADTYDDIVLGDLKAFFGELGYYGYQFIKHRSLNPSGESVVG